MMISEETRAKLNDVLTKSFLLNMICDNLVYQIDYAVYPETAELVHKSYAHHWPEVADEWSDFMVQMDVKPIRGALNAEYEDYNGDLVGIFSEILEATDEYRKAVLELIELADMNDDHEVVIKAEDIALKMVPYRKQASIWLTEAKRYSGDYKSFDVHVKSFTKLIPIID